MFGKRKRQAEKARQDRIRILKIEREFAIDWRNTPALIRVESELRAIDADW
jgi:hypothetical protein